MNNALSSEERAHLSDRAVAPTKIRVDGLAMSYAAGNAARTVLENVHIDIPARQFISIVGHSGAGKTTLLRCISGLERSTAGSVRFDGKEISGPPEKLALIFQDYGRSLFPWLRVLANVTLPLRADKKLTAKQRAATAEAALEAVGLSDAVHQYPWQLSGGMQQRVAIARALACEPEVLLMDEPFASVDAQTRSDLEDLVLGICRRYRMTTILVTHDVDESVYMSDRVVVLGGRPTTVAELIDVDLPADRDQVTTKSLPEFIALRTRVLQAVRSVRRASGPPVRDAQGRPTASERNGDAGA